jgi:hypothetical protein
VQRLGWAFDHRDVGAAAGLLAADLQFQTFETDSAGNTPALVQWPRDSVLAALRSLFDGVPGVSEAATATLSLDRNLVPFTDTRPGKNPIWHKMVRSSADIRVADPTSGSRIDVTGYLLFYLTRGGQRCDSRGSGGTGCACRFHPVVDRPVRRRDAERKRRARPAGADECLPPDHVRRHPPPLPRPHAALSSYSPSATRSRRS